MTSPTPMEPEIVWKEHFVTVTGDNDAVRAIFSGILVCNAEGFRWLASYFARRADAAEKLERSYARNGYITPHPDPDDHVHLSTTDAPFNSAMSDEAELRIGHLVPSNRKDVLSKYEMPSARREFLERHRHLLFRATEAERP